MVLASGLTYPTNEFTTPYQIINWHACNSCWNEVRERFDHKDFLGAYARRTRRARSNARA